jgi:hypothetical protein
MAASRSRCFSAVAGALVPLRLALGDDLLHPVGVVFLHVAATAALQVRLAPGLLVVQPAVEHLADPGHEVAVLLEVLRQRHHIGDVVPEMRL